MNTKPKTKISVIVPIYNVEKTLKKCVDSILNQTYKNPEIILIDDCSQDNSVAIAMDYSARYENVILLRQPENQGVDQARHLGLKNAKGEYIMFVDSDDWLPPNAIEILLFEIENENADVVTGSLVRVLDKFKLIKTKPKNNYLSENFKESITLPQLWNDYFISYFGVNKLPVSMCGKLYRKSVLDIADIQPTGFKMGEDLLFNMQLHPYLKKISFVEDVVYYYKFGGMTTKENPTFLNDIKKQYFIKKKYAEKYNYSNAILYIRIELVNCFYSYYLKKLQIRKFDKLQFIDSVAAELEDSVYSELQSINSSKSNLLISKNYEEIYRLVHRKFKKDKVKYGIKKLISSFLT